jgi:hypothetical protein
VTGGWITQADRERWQRDAVRELAAILDAHPGLPLIAWFVAPAGGSLSGRISGAGTTAAFTAWKQALGLEDVPGVPAAVWLRASGRRGAVRITVTALAGGRDAW